MPDKKNQFRKSANIDEQTFIRLVYCFCQWLGIETAARKTRLTPKTVRATYIDLRRRLLKPAFDRWHGTNVRFLKLSKPEY